MIVPSQQGCHKGEISKLHVTLVHGAHLGNVSWPQAPCDFISHHPNSVAALRPFLPFLTHAFGLRSML